MEELVKKALTITIGLSAFIVLSYAFVGGPVPYWQNLNIDLFNKSVHYDKGLIYHPDVNIEKATREIFFAGVNCIKSLIDADVAINITESGNIDLQKNANKFAIHLFVKKAKDSQGNDIYILRSYQFSNLLRLIFSEESAPLERWSKEYGQSNYQRTLEEYLAVKSWAFLNDEINKKTAKIITLTLGTTLKDWLMQKIIDDISASFAEESGMVAYRQYMINNHPNIVFESEVKYRLAMLLLTLVLLCTLLHLPGRSFSEIIDDTFSTNEVKASKALILKITLLNLHLLIFARKKSFEERIGALLQKEKDKDKKRIYEEKIQKITAEAKNVFAEIRIILEDDIKNPGLTGNYKIAIGENPKGIHVRRNALLVLNKELEKLKTPPPPIPLISNKESREITRRTKKEKNIDRRQRALNMLRPLLLSLNQKAENSLSKLSTNSLEILASSIRKLKDINQEAVRKLIIDPNLSQLLRRNSELVVLLNKEDGAGLKNYLAGYLGKFFAIGEKEKEIDASFLNGEDVVLVGDKRNNKKSVHQGFIDVIMELGAANCVYRKSYLILNQRWSWPANKLFIIIETDICHGVVFRLRSHEARYLEVSKATKSTFRDKLIEAYAKKYLEN